MPQFRYILQALQRLAMQQLNQQPDLGQTSTTQETYYKKFGARASQNKNIKPDGWGDAKPFSAIPGPKRWPLIGNMLSFAKYGEYYNVPLVEMLQMIRDRYGDVVNLSMPPRPLTVWLFDPKDVEILMRNEGAYPVRLPFYAVKYYRTIVRDDVYQGIQGLVISNGEEWFKMRAFANKIMMQPRTAHMYVASMDDVASDFIDNIRNLLKQNPDKEMPKDFQNEIYKWSLESVGLIAYNKRLGCLDRNNKADTVGQMMINNSVAIIDLMYRLEFVPNLSKYINTKTWKEYVKQSDFLTFTNVKFIEECLEEIKKRNYNLSENDQSILERLMKYDKKIAIATSIDLLSAGIETTGNSVAIALYFLAKNPQKQEKLRQEIYRYLPHKDSRVTRALTQETPYLKAVIKESARIAPVFPGTERITVKDLVIGGYRIPKGTCVTAASVIISNDEKHFKESKAFIPERWLRNTNDEYSAKDLNPFVTMPFGVGPRSCVARRLANLELEVVLSKIVRNFKISWPHQNATFKNTLLSGIAEPLKFRMEEIDD